MRGNGSCRGAVGILVVCLFGVPSQASADAQVEVSLRGPSGKLVEGEVSLVSGDDKLIASCQTKGGSCRMDGVAGGSYRVKVKPAKGSPPKAKTVMIPPSGKVSLIVATGG